MKKHLEQIRVIAGLEIGRVFLSRRAVWVYLLALFPAVIFIGHGIHVQQRRQSWTAHGAVPAEVLASFAPGATEAEVREKAGKPVEERSWTRRRPRREREGDEDEGPRERRFLNYYDGSRRVYFDFEDGKLVRTGSEALSSLEEDRKIYAAVFQYFYLRLAVFFGCLGIFINLFRGEMIDKSLHFWFLAPVRREVLLLGKYAAGLAAAGVIFGMGALLSFAGLVAFADAGERQAYLAGDGWSHLAWYLAAAVLGCVGYGSVFLASGLLLRNPIVPAVVMLVWESINGFLPDLLQKLSVLHYLQSVCPVPAPIDSGAPPLLRLLLAPAAPSSTWVAVVGLMAFTALILWAATQRVKRLEINYGTE